jgi:hypothetical protein
VRAALDTLPALLAQRLGDLLGEELEDVVVHAPLRMEIRATVAELRAAATRAGCTDSASAGAVMTLLNEQVDVALRDVLARSDASHIHGSARVASPTVTEDPTRAHLRARQSAESIQVLLARWHRAQRLTAYLGLLSPAALALLRRLTTQTAGVVTTTTALRLPRDAAIEDAAAEIGATQSPSGAEARDQNLVWLLAATALNASPTSSANYAEIVAALDALLPPDQDARALDGATATSPAESMSESPAVVTLTAVPPPRHIKFRRGTRDLYVDSRNVAIDSALPFLLLGPLSHIGYLEAIETLISAAGLRAHLPALAAALAYKVLPPPERGWRRTAASARPAAAFAGLRDAPPEAELHALHEKLVPYLEPASATLAQSLIAGHTLGSAIVLAAAGDGFLLADAPGVFPLAWGARVEELAPVLRALGNETIFVPRASASPSLLRCLDADCARFVTDAPPTRGERWRAVRRAGSTHWWTNDDATIDDVLVRRAGNASEAAEHIDSLWTALFCDRRSVALVPDSPVDRALTLAASVALATLAWTLWRDRESTTPLLALHRLGDLSARVHFGTHVVRVVVPLGRRHRDLAAGGLLGPVRDVPWLGGRTLELGGG